MDPRLLLGPIAKGQAIVREEPSCRYMGICFCAKKKGEFERKKEKKNEAEGKRKKRRGRGDDVFCERGPKKKSFELEKKKIKEQNKRCDQKRFKIDIYMF